MVVGRQLPDRSVGELPNWTAMLIKHVGASIQMHYTFTRVDRTVSENEWYYGNNKSAADNGETISYDRPHNNIPPVKACYCWRRTA